MTKLCECGCGLPAPLATVTRLPRGHIKGQPIRFIKGHNMKLHGQPGLGNKGPLDKENFDRLLVKLQAIEARSAARRQRFCGLRNYGKPRRAARFSHLPPAIRRLAEIKLKQYMERNKVKLASLSGLPRVRYLGSLCGAAAAHALRGNWIPPESGKRGLNMERHANAIRTRLGLRHRRPSWGKKGEGGMTDRELIDRELALVAAAPVEPVPQAEAGQASLEGI